MCEHTISSRQFRRQTTSLPPLKSKSDSQVYAGSPNSLLAASGDTLDAHMVKDGLVPFLEF